jgi:deoxyribonuclease-4
MHLIGSHCPDTGGIAMAVARAGQAGMQAMQLFTAVPKYYNEKVGVKPERAARFREALAASGTLRAEHVMAHAAYVLNVATPDAAKWERAAAGLAKELERACTLGLGLLCFHPGAATDGDRDAAVARVSVAMTRALESTDGPTRLLVENTAGAGTTVGRTPEEIGAILAGIPHALRARAGYGLDTCHLYASGYDLARDAAAVRETLDAFERAAGAPPAFFHLNDSEGALGSNKDRHRLLGEGAIGEAAFGCCSPIRAATTCRSCSRRRTRSTSRRRTIRRPMRTTCAWWRCSGGWRPSGPRGSTGRRPRRGARRVRTTALVRRRVPPATNRLLAPDPSSDRVSARVGGSPIAHAAPAYGYCVPRGGA